MWLLLSTLVRAQSVQLIEDSFTVHTKVSLQVRVTAGADGFQAGDVLVIDDPVLHGARWVKWGWLSHRGVGVCSPIKEDWDGSSAGRIAAFGPQGESLEVLHTLDDAEIHEAGQVLVTLDADIAPGESVRIALGTEEEGGDCGWQTPVRAFDNIPLPISYWPLGADEDTLIDAPLVHILAEEDVDQWVVSVTSQAAVGEEVVVRAAPLDRWGNLARGQEILLSSHRFEAEGVQRIPVEIDGETLWSNPVRVTQESLDWGVFWGDLHTHHGHSYETEAGDWVDQNHDYARDVVGLDFGCESVKLAPTEIDGEALWERVQRSCEAYSVDGDYLALLGFEWMGAGSGAGHHNVYYESCEGPYLEQEALVDLEDGLWPFMEQTMAETGQLMVSVPHAPSFTGFDWEVQDDTLRPVAEVFSEWGSSMDPQRAGSVPEGLSGGQRLGFIASSDNHDGWLGNSAARKNTQGGLAAILAPELSPGALLSSLQNRATYATTGARILLELVAWEQDSPHPMGSSFVSRDARFDWKVHGTDTIERVRLVYAPVGAQESGVEWARWSPSALDAEGSAQVPYSPRELAVWLEVTQVDQEMAWSSPIWLEREAAVTGCAGSPVGALALLGGLGLGLGISRRRRPAG